MCDPMSGGWGGEIPEGDRAQSGMPLARKRYDAPSLIRYGTIFDLTAEGNKDPSGDFFTFASGEAA
jgi:hypothetical protein